MAWTAPRTWVSGAVLTAAQLNTDIRDNMLSLGTYNSYTPTIVGTASPTVAASYAVVGDDVSVHVKLTLTAAITAPLTMSLPVNANAIYSNVNSDFFRGNALLRNTVAGGANRAFGFVGFDSVTTASFYYNATAATVGQVSSGTTPWTWASTHTIVADFVYRKA